TTGFWSSCVSSPLLGLVLGAIPLKYSAHWVILVKGRKPVESPAGLLSSKGRCRGRGGDHTFLVFTGSVLALVSPTCNTSHTGFCTSRFQRRAGVVLSSTVRKLYTMLREDMLSKLLLMMRRKQVSISDDNET
ncbi:hypothetical protein SISNIDRAFT_453582, partial [Sistotremastrum niveocremeum HHB9708]